MAIETVGAVPDGPRPLKMRQLADIAESVYPIMVHGGLGDAVWVYKKLAMLSLPLHVTVASENRHRPRRVGRLLDHLPRVVGWCYADESFAPGGQDWTDPKDPVCAIGKTWAELGWEPNARVPYRIECNRHLESGRRLEEWLPDLNTLHHFLFETPGPPRREPTRPAVVIHMAGWPDVADPVWTQACRVFHGLAKVYVVGGSYDYRPRRLFESLGRHADVELVEDASWEDLWAVLAASSYCFGHASGLTAVADVMGLSGAVYNPASVPYLIGTWNDPTNTRLLQIDRVADFEEAIYVGYTALAGKPAATWPPSATRAGALVCEPRLAHELGIGAVYAAARYARPREALVVIEPTPDHPAVSAGLPAAIIDAAADGGTVLSGITAVGATIEQVDRMYAAAGRISRRAAIELPSNVEQVTHQSVAYDLVVIVAPIARADVLLRWAWARTSARGTVLLYCPDDPATARVAAVDVFRGRRTDPAEVESAPGWVYVHRRS